MIDWALGRPYGVRSRVRGMASSLTEGLPLSTVCLSGMIPVVDLVSVRRRSEPELLAQGWKLGDVLAARSSNKDTVPTCSSHGRALGIFSATQKLPTAPHY